MLSAGIKKSESKMYPFKVCIDMDRLFETEKKAQEYLTMFIEYDESVRERL